MICGGFSTEKPTNSKGYGTNSIQFFFCDCIGMVMTVMTFLLVYQSRTTMGCRASESEMEKIWGNQSCLQRGLGEVFWRKLSVKRSNEKDLFMKPNEKVDGSLCVIYNISTLELDLIDVQSFWKDIFDPMILGRRRSKRGVPTPIFLWTTCVEGKHVWF